MKAYTNRKRFFIAPIILVAVTGFSFITMLLWNALLPEIFHLPQITFWQAAGLLILSRLLFGFSGHGRGHHGRRHAHLREKWEKMSPQEREEFMHRMHRGRHCCEEGEDKQTTQDSPENK